MSENYHLPSWKVMIVSIMESEALMDDPARQYDASEALAAVDKARTALLQRAEEGSWRYDLIYSVLAAGVVMAQALPLPFNTLADAGIVAAFLILARWQRARTGVWISGVGPKRARWAALGIGLIAGIAALGAAIEGRQGQTWVALALGPLVGLVALLGSRLWRRMFRLEVETGVEVLSSGGRPWVWLLLGLGLACALVAGVLAMRRIDPYIVGLFMGVAIALMASPGLIALKRRVMLR